MITSRQKQKGLLTVEKYTVKKYEGNLQCNWCDKKAEYTIRDNHVQWTDHACKDHLQKWFPEAQPA